MTTDPTLSLKLELLCAQKDAQLAELRAQIIVEKLRKLCGVSDAAELNPQTFMFTEPTPTPEEVK